VRRAARVAAVGLLTAAVWVPVFGLVGLLAGAGVGAFEALCAAGEEMDRQPHHPRVRRGAPLYMRGVA